MPQPTQHFPRTNKTSKMMQASQSWDQLRRSAKTIERTLEDKIAAYSAISKNVTKLSSEYDEENPSEETAEEREIPLEIERNLISLSDIIDEMSAHTAVSSNKTQEAVLQRYREIYFDFKTEFKRTMASIQEKRDSQKLFGKRNKNMLSEDAEMDSLLKERNAVDSSRSLASSIIEQALATKASLQDQRNRFMSSNTKMNTLSNSFAGVNSLMDQIKRKKLRNNTIIALVIAACICFTLWWTILSKT